MTTTRGLGSTGSYTGGSARWDGLQDRGPKTVSIRDLPQESQAAHELLKQLKLVDLKGRATLLERAGVKEPVTQSGLAAVAELFFRLEMPLNPAGINRFKAERGLGNGPNLAGNVARAYARAVVGGEVLFRVTAEEEANLRPADKACLAFLRQWSRTPRVAELVGRLKEALDLGNPELGADAAALANEYIGAQTVREVSRASSMNHCELTPDGMLQLIDIVEAQRAKGMPASSPATSPSTLKPAAPASTLPPKFAGSIPAQRVQTLVPASDVVTQAGLKRPSQQAVPAADPVTQKTTRPSSQQMPAADPVTTKMTRPSSQQAPTPAADPPTQKVSEPVTRTGLKKRPT